MRGLKIAAAMVAFGMAAPCAAQSQGSPAYHDLVDASEGFNGVALVGTGDHVTFVEGVGRADVANGVPMRANTRFETGSVSKWIASIVILKLVDQGKLDLDAPITRYLPEYRADTGARLTLKRLMSHSSGVPNDILAVRKDPAMRGVELEQMEAVRRYASGDLAFEPGTAWDYSHSNWLIAKAVVERVSGKPYAALVDQLLVKPLGLKDSGVYGGDSGAVKGMALGYAGLVPEPVRKPNPVPGFMAMAGGYYTSAPELMKLMNAVLDGKLLSPASRKALMTVLMPDQHYALGGRVRTEKIGGKEREAAWEDGSNGGFRMLARRVLADGHTVIVFTNASYDYQKLGDLGTALLDASYAPEAQAGRPSR
ncbi:serine hydrolase [Sphingomonas sp. HITSZ_GF]|uniref:serine hydrolase domain-containing protein n=1 Tax=Sphingomonas sp. HITSZ_GF TaxID=3037247 RepID=UPI00240E4E91|nr:serine hydrolase domain-containing protein [Sphingomonas sp. HITSZ_GF]MDG2532377.1 serine hydrolase [Sphingomonas sp. HITSZ_GF]